VDPFVVDFHRGPGFVSSGCFICWKGWVRERVRRLIIP
jgi:hypothetical protein